MPLPRRLTYQEQLDSLKAAKPRQLRYYEQLEGLFPEETRDEMYVERPTPRQLTYAEQMDSIAGRSPLNNLGRGFAKELQGTGTSFVGAIGTLSGSQGLQDWAKRQEELGQKFYDPEGTSGKVGRVAGRIVGEVGTAVVGGAAGLKALTKVAPKAAAAIQGASRLKRVAALSAAQAPIDIVQGVQSESGLLLPGRLGSIAENVLLSGAGSALVRPVKPVASAKGGLQPGLVGPEEVAAAKPESWLSDADVLRTEVDDMHLPILRFAEQVGGEAGLNAAKGRLGRLYGVRGQMQQFVEDHVAPLTKGFTKPQEDLWANLVHDRRVLSIKDKGGGWKSAETEAVVRARVALAEATGGADLLASADMVPRLYKDLLKRRLDAGLINKASFDKIVASDDFYTPFHAELGVVEPGVSGVRSADLSGVSRMERAKGVSQRYLHPKVAMLEAVYNTLDDVAKQHVKKVVSLIADAAPVGAADGASSLVRRLSLDEARKAQDAALGSPGSMTFTQIDAAGQKVTYEVRDRLLYDAIVGQTPEVQSKVWSLLEAFKTMKHIGATLLPDFALANLVRDTGMSGVQRMARNSFVKETVLGGAVGAAAGAAQEDADGMTVLKGLGLGVAGGGWARPVVRTLKSVALVAGKADQYKEFMRAGGSTNGFYVRTPKDAAEALVRLERSGVRASDIINPRSWFEALQYVGSVAEQASRLAAFTEARGSGMSLGRAAMEAQERTLPFGKTGASRVAQKAYSSTAFLSARVKGLYKLGEMIKKPQTWGLGVTMFTAPSLVLWDANKDNPEYWDTPQWVRSTFWLIPKKGGGFFHIMKPHELGYLFASLPEAFMDYLARKGHIASAAPALARPGAVTADAALGMGSALVSGLLPVPDLVSTVGQLATGRDFFRGRDIVTRPSLTPEQQVTERSSTLARGLAGVGVAPEKTDFAVRAVGANLGQLGSNLVDVEARRRARAEDGQSSASKTVGDLGRTLTRAVTKRFNTDATGTSEAVLQALKRSAALDAVRAGWNDVRRTGTEDEQAAFKAKYATDLQSLEASTAYMRRMDRLHELSRKIGRARDLSPGEKRERLTQLRLDSERTAALINAR